MQIAVTTIDFKTKCITIGNAMIIRIPEDQSALLASHGQIAVTGSVNDIAFQTVLEPDGYWSHYIKVDDKLRRELDITSDDVVSVKISPTKKWPEPIIPNDVAKALAAAPEKARNKWSDITAMARWEWIRWVNSTANETTRHIRVEKTISKLNGKHRRPCCFNLAACTDPELSKSGRLFVPET